MSKIIEAVYENGVFRPLEPVVLPDGEHVQVRVPEGSPSQHECLAALEAFEAMDEELTKEQWEVFEEAVQRRPWFGGRQLDQGSWPLILIPQGRKKALYGTIRRFLGPVLRALAGQRGSTLVAGHRGQDHVHMCIRMPRSMPWPR